jgi:hypothetical protein
MTWYKFNRLEASSDDVAMLVYRSWGRGDWFCYALALTVEREQARARRADA